MNKTKILLLATIGILATTGCTSMVMTRMTGEDNMKALEASWECKMNDALRYSRMDLHSSEPTHRMMSYYNQAAFYTDMGQTAKANNIIATIKNDPVMNPKGKSTAEIRSTVQKSVDGIRRKRMEKIGRTGC